MKKIKAKFDKRGTTISTLKKPIIHQDITSDESSSELDEAQVLQEPNYLSTEHESEEDIVRNTLEENDDVYNNINYMLPHYKLRSDPART